MTYILNTKSPFISGHSGSSSYISSGKSSDLSESQLSPTASSNGCIMSSPCYRKRRESIENPAILSLNDTKKVDHSLYAKTNSIFDDPKELASFISFLKTDFSIDMMLLWNSIEKYKVYYIHNMDPPPKLALSIYSSFIPYGAPMEIPIPDKIRSRLYDHLMTRVQASQSPTLFYELQQELLYQFETEQLTDFLNSYICNEQFHKYRISYVQHLSYKCIIENDDLRPFLIDFLNKNFPSDIVLVNLLNDIFNFNHIFASEDREDSATEIFNKYLKPHSSISNLLDASEYDSLQQQIHHRTLGHYPFRSLQEKCLNLIDKDIDNTFRTSDIYGKLLEFYYKAPLDMIMSSLLAQSPTVLLRSIFPQYTTTTTNSNESKYSESKEIEECKRTSGRDSSHSSSSLNDSFRRKRSSRTSPVIFPEISSLVSDNRYNNSLPLTSRSSCIALYQSIQIPWTKGNKPVIGIAGILADPESKSIFSDFLLDKYHLKDSVKLVEFLRSIRNVEKTSQLTLRLTKLQTITKKYLTGDMNLSSYFDRKIVDNVIAKLDTDDFEITTINPVRDFLTDMISAYFVPRYLFYTNTIGFSGITKST